MRARALSSLVSVVAAAALLIPATAQAGVTSSTVNQPADGSTFTYDQLGPAQPDVTIAGTSNGTDTDTVDIICDDNSGTPGAIRYIKTGVAVATDGSFSTTIARSKIIPGPCVIRAITGSVDPATLTLSDFAGPRVMVPRYRKQLTLPDGTNAGHLYDFYTWQQATLAGSDYLSVGSCGLCDSKLFYPGSFTSSNYLWFANGALYGDERTGRAYAQIDGRNAIAPGDPFFQFRPSVTQAYTQPGFPVLTYSFSDGPGPGELTINETDPFVHCFGQESAWPPASSGDCPSFVPTGVVLDRQIVQSADGRTIWITDTWRSTDGAAHTLDLDYDQYFADSPDHPSFEFPWVGSAYATHVAGDTIPGPAGGPATLFVRGDALALDGNTQYPQGALTFQPAATLAHFYGTTGVRNFYLRFHVVVPAGGTSTVSQVFNMATTRADLDAMSSAAEDKLSPPTVSITAPANGTVTSTPSALVSGTATDNKGVTSFTVNGVPTTLGAGGSWSRSVALAPGANTITAAASDAAGNTTQAQETITYAPVHVSVRSRRIRVVGFTVLLPVTCTAAPGTRCLGDVLETTRVKTAGRGRASGVAARTRAVTVGRKSFSIPAGRTQVVRVKLSAKGRRLLRRSRRHRLPVALTVRFRNPATGRATTASVVHLTLKLPAPGRHH